MKVADIRIASIKFQSMKKHNVYKKGGSKMTTMLTQIKNDMDRIVSEWLETNYLNRGNLFVIGCSTSEVDGEHIGTSGSEAIAEVILNSLQQVKQEKGIEFAFQCCEHLNRAIVMERTTQEKMNLYPVTVIPHPTAGGSMASYAFKHLSDAVVVEEVNAHAGIDIGDTMIGMH